MVPFSIQKEGLTINAFIKFPSTFYIILFLQHFGKERVTLDIDGFNAVQFLRSRTIFELSVALPPNSGSIFISTRDCRKISLQSDWASNRMLLIGGTVLASGRTSAKPSMTETDNATVREILSKSW